MKLIRSFRPFGQPSGDLGQSVYLELQRVKVRIILSDVINLEDVTEEVKHRHEL